MTHLFADEKLGGVKREYVEVDRKAAVGDYVYLSRVCEKTAGHIRKVSRLSEFEGDFRIEETVNGTDYVNSDFDEYRTLEPTDIVVIEGERYKLEERRAKVGEKIISLVDDQGPDKEYTFGSTHVVSDVEQLADGDYCVGISEISGFYYTDRYRVLVPVDSEPTEPTPDIHGLIANLVRRTTELERTVGELVRTKSSLESRLADVQANVQTFGEQTESNTQDIAFLAERTNKKSAEDILREISKLLERSER